jgi:hypothetical protein
MAAVDEGASGICPVTCHAEIKCLRKQQVVGIQERDVLTSRLMKTGVAGCGEARIRLPD